jgi:lysophospholipase L1-like esterase
MRFATLVVAASAFILVYSQYAYPNGVHPSFQDGHWIDTWTAMPQLTEYTNLPNPPFNETGLDFFNSTIRQTLKVSLPAPQIRIRLSNELSPVYLNITSMTIAVPGGNHSAGQSFIETTTLQTITFSGNESVNIPNGAQVVSDPLNFFVTTNDIISISMYLANGQQTTQITSHPGSRINIFYTSGNQISATNITGPNAQTVAHWYFLSAVEAWVPKSQSSFMIVGDSITDGRGSTTDANNRWPDLLFDRMQAAPSPVIRSISYGNVAAGGNRLLDDGNGPNALARFTRDVVAHSGVKYAMIFEGVNDIGTTSNDTTSQAIIGEQIIFVFQQMITRAHAMGIPMFGATITPFSAPNSTIQVYSDPIRERTRQSVNAWIRAEAHFDGVVDFDAVVRDPEVEGQLAPEYNSGDYLHPNVLGYEAMAAAFPLGLFEEFAGGVSFW